jgi:cytochrome c-type biogenesis protein CcmF
MFLLVVIGGSLLLYAVRAPNIPRGGGFGALSRESLLLGNNVLLIVTTALVLLGTLAPLVYDAFGWGKISVGFPWFNTMFVTFMPLLIIIMGAGPLTRWKHNDPAALAKRLKLALLISVAAGIVAALPFSTGSISAGIAVALSTWLATTLVSGMRQRLKNKPGISGFIKDLSGRGGRSYYGMWLAHIGIAVFVIGVTFVTQFDIEKDARMTPGQSIELSGYQFRFEGVNIQNGPNYRSQFGTVRVFRDEKEVALLNPEKRTYLVQTKPMTEAGIDAGFMRDIYVSLGEPLGGGDWSVRLYYKPFVRWIWLGCIFIAAGGLLAASDPRYRNPMRRRQAAAATTAGNDPAVRSHA